MFKSFYDVPEEFVRGTWVYCVSSDKKDVFFGSIQGIDLSKKAVLFGIELVQSANRVNEIRTPSFFGNLEWVTQWMIAPNVEKFLNVTLAENPTLKSKAVELIEFLEKQHWYRSLHLEDGQTNDI